MQMEWLRAFVLLKKKMNFSDAAQEMYVSQSSFSKYIKALENEVGATLVDRSRHRFSFTPEGETIYPYIRRILTEYDGMLSAVSEATLAQKQRLRISVDSAANAYVYIRHILDFFEEHPEYELQLHEYDTMDALKGLDAGELDMVIGYTNLAGKEHPYGELRLREEELLYVGSRSSLCQVCPDICPNVSAGAENAHTEVKNASAGVGFCQGCRACEETEASADQGGHETTEEEREIMLSRVIDDHLILHQNLFQEISRALESSGIRLSTDHPVATTTSMDVLRAYLQRGTARSLLTRTAADALDPEKNLVRLRIRQHPAVIIGLLYQKEFLNYTGKELLNALSSWKKTEERKKVSN